MAEDLDPAPSAATHFPLAPPAHRKLGQLAATAICGNDITSSCLYVSALTILYAGTWAPVALLLVGGLLYLFRSIYAEVVGALPLNGGAYNALLNTTSKFRASMAACLTILSYMATAVISANEAMHYVAALWAPWPILYATIGLLALFMGLTILGIGESAAVAIGIFLFHIATLTLLVILGVLFVVGHGVGILMANFHVPAPGGFAQAIFFGFCASLLGISGFESSANFVEEQADGVFPKTLRNMWLAVTFFNPVIALLTLALVPIGEVARHEEALLAHMGGITGGGWLATLIAGDGRACPERRCPDQLHRRHWSGGTHDARSLLAAESPEEKPTRHDAPHYRRILRPVRVGAAHHARRTQGAGGRLYHFLSRGHGALWLRQRAPEDQARRAAASDARVLAGGADGHRRGRSRAARQREDESSVSQVLPRILRPDRAGGHRHAHTHRNPQGDRLRQRQDRCIFFASASILTWMAREKIHEIVAQRVVFFTRGDNLANLNRAILYVRENEHTNRMKIVTVLRDARETPPRLERDLQFLDEAYPEIDIEFVAIEGEFGPQLIQRLSQEWRIPTNLMFIGSPAGKLPYDLGDLGGVRLIV